MGDDRPGSVAKRSGEVSSTGLRMLEVLERHTRFPWPLFKAQCTQHGFDPSGVDVAMGRAMVDDLARSLESLTDHATAVRARAELEAVLSA